MQCTSANKIIIICHVILENHVIKVLKSTITIFSKAHGMSYLHIQNFTIKVALTKIFFCVANDSDLILVTSSCMTNDPSKNDDRKKKEKKKKRKSVSKVFALYVNAKKSYRNRQYSPHYLSKSLRDLFRGLLERTKSQVKEFFSQYKPYWRQLWRHINH